MTSTPTTTPITPSLLTANTLLFPKIHNLAAHAQWQPLIHILLLALEANDTQNLIELQTTLLKSEGPQSWTPLMLSCARAPPEVIALLLKCCPGSCTVSDRSGSYPLHFVCSWRRGGGEGEGGTMSSDLQDVIQILLHFSPESVRAQNLWGQTPLHCLFDGEAMPPLDGIKALLGLRTPSSDAKNTPIAPTDEEQQSEEILRRHVRTALSRTDTKSNLPLHLAASKGASEEILRLLVSLHPEAATVPTADGDLPLHLLQYYAEDIATTNEQGTTPNERERENSMLGNTKLHHHSYHPASSSTTTNTTQHRRIQLRMFRAVTVGQVESLLEPLCGYGFVETTIPGGARSSEGCVVGTILGTGAVGVKENGTLRSISERTDEECDTENERSVEVDSKQQQGGGLKSIQSVSSVASTRNGIHSAIAAACQSSGSRRIHPIHIAAEYGVSYRILVGLCEQYPEGVAIPRSRLCCFQQEGEEGGRSASSTKDEKESLDIYPIELFENGRAQLDMENATVMWNWHVANSNSTAPVNDTFIADAINRFHQKSDLLFAHFPEAVPNKYNGTKHLIMYHEEPLRLSRLEDLIRNDILDTTKLMISVTARLSWIWFFRCAKFLNESEKGIFQACIGRIIAGLPDSALWTLGCIVKSITSKHSTAHSSSTIIIEEHGDETSFGQLGHFINEKNIKEEALERAPKTNMAQVLQILDFDEFTDSLSGQDLMNYSSSCQKARSSGYSFLPKDFLKETGCTWNLRPRDELTGSHKSEYWQQLDDYLISPNSVHLVYITYYLEVSEAKPTSVVPSVEYNRNLSNKPTSWRTTGGLMVLRQSHLAAEERKLENNSLKNTKSYGMIVETKEQKKVVSGRFLTREGCEVQLCFKYKPGNRYSLHVYGPLSGGRVSVSSARIRKIVQTTRGRGSREEKRASPQLSTQVTTLCSTNLHYGGELQLHHALRNGVSVEDLSVLIAANPSSLLEVDDQGRTALHTIFFLDKFPSLSIMKTLLTSPGENATKLKDLSVRLPLHIAASRGANEATLRLLVEAYADGCYRLNKEGDLPLHLLVRSGRATTSSVELLLRPILDNETICRIQGSQGLELPLHIAAEYNCSYKVLESLLLTYGEAASVPRQRPKQGKSLSPPLLALDIFEQMKSKVISHISKKADSILERTENLNLDTCPIHPRDPREAARFDMTVADLNLRSDLLFVFNPTLAPVKVGEPARSIYRKDSTRMKRISNLIRREAIACADRRKTNVETEISEMARLGWYFLCTFNNLHDSKDNYAESVASVLKGLPKSVVQVLQDCISNPLSTSTQIPITDCAIPLCKQLILSRIQFVGRYILEDNDSVVHESDGSLVIGAKDYSLVERYLRILSLFKTEDLPDVDDLNSIAGSIITSVLLRDDPKLLFTAFARKIGFNEEGANREFERIVFYQDDDIPTGIEEGYRVNGIDFQESNRRQKKDFTLEMFRKFCLSHKIDEDGVRSVIIKFMKHRSQFLREKSIRGKLDFVGPNFAIFPIIDDYDTDNIDKGNSNRDTSQMSSWNLQDSKDALYAIDIHELKNSTHNFSLYNYALVMPRGDRDLAEIMLHEECDMLTVQDHMYQIGTALEKLHNTSTIHGDLNLSNVVRYGTKVALIDFDSSFFYDKGGNVDAQSEAIGGSSHKCCSGIMPPELIAKIDLWENSDLLRNYEKYWKHVLDDAADMKKLIANARKITTAVKALIAQSEAIKTMGSALTSLRMTMKDRLPGIHDSDRNMVWKEVISKSLVGLSFEDLPDSLTSCETIQDFAGVWTRLKVNSLFWEKIHPRISSDGRYAYMVKSYDNSQFSLIRKAAHSSNSLDLLPYSLVQASTKYDIWAFGLMLFYVCSGVSLLHLTYSGHLCNSHAYEELHNWDSEVAREKISNFVDDPLARNLLMKLLVAEDNRLSSMELILQHPFFRSSMGKDVDCALEEYENKLCAEITHSTTISVKSDSVNNLKMLCMEKYCKEVFSIQEDISVPTCFIILPYHLCRNSLGHLEAPQNITSLSIGEKIGKHLLDINTATAKLSFWLKMKVFISEENGTEFRARLRLWLQRARTEASQDIAKEMISSIGCDKHYESICVELLDEGMSVSNAREFIKDPWKAASTLFNKSKHALLQYYPRSRTHPLYLIDERHATVALPEEFSDDMDNVYPIEIEMTDVFEEIFLPLINMTVMSVTAKYGMKGLASLLGLPSSYGIPDTWKNSKIGLVHGNDASGSSSISEFTHFQQALSKNNGKNHLSTFIEGSTLENLDSPFGIRRLEVFYQQNDPTNSFSGLNRFCDRDGSNVAWTRNEAAGFQKTSGRGQLDCKLENNMEHKNVMASQGASYQRLKRTTGQYINLPQSAPNATQSITRNLKTRANSPGQKIPSPLSVFTRTTKQSLSTATGHSTMVSNPSLDRHHVMPSESTGIACLRNSSPLCVKDRQKDEPYFSKTTPRDNEYLLNQGNFSSMAPTTASNLALHNHSALLSIGAKQKHEIPSSMASLEDGGYFSRQGNDPSMISSVTLKKHHPTPSDISSMVSNSTMERHAPRNTFLQH